MKIETYNSTVVFVVIFVVFSLAFGSFSVALAFMRASIRHVAVKISRVHPGEFFVCFVYFF